MPCRDLHNELKISQLFPPVAAVTDNSAQVSNIIDCANFDSLELVMTYGSLSDTDATFTVLIEHGAISSLSDNATAASFLLGGVAGTIAAGASDGTGCTPGFADDNKTFKVGYIGNKRYVRVTITPAANSGNIYLAGVAIQGHARSVPQSSQSV